MSISYNSVKVVLNVNTLGFLRELTVLFVFFLDNNLVLLEFIILGF